MKSCSASGCSACYLCLRRWAGLEGIRRALVGPAALLASSSLPATRKRQSCPRDGRESGHRAHFPTAPCTAADPRLSCFRFLYRAPHRALPRPARSLQTFSEREPVPLLLNDSGLLQSDWNMKSWRIIYWWTKIPRPQASEISSAWYMLWWVTCLMLLAEVL